MMKKLFLLFLLYLPFTTKSFSAKKETIYQLACEGKYECPHPKCNRIFEQSAHLKQHIETKNVHKHLDYLKYKNKDNKYECPNPKCKQTFRRRADLKKHIKYHHKTLYNTLYNT